MKLKNLIGAICLFTASFSNAGLITFNEVEVQALDLNGQVETYQEWYDYRNNVSHTGFEIGQEIVMFMTELNEASSNKLGMVMLISGPNADRIRLQADFSYSDGLIQIKDDPNEFTDPFSVFFKVGLNKSDGLVFTNTGGNLIFDVAFSSIVGTSIINFLTFDDNGVASTAFRGIIPQLVQVRAVDALTAVSAPALFGLMFASMLLILRRRT